MTTARLPGASSNARAGTRGEASVWLLVPLGMAALELSHPTWSAGPVAEGVAAAGGWWVPLHLLLAGGYWLLIAVLWRTLAGARRQAEPLVQAARLVLLTFGVCNTAFLAVDGLALGWLAEADPSAVDRLWNAPIVLLLANVSGATLAAALLCTACALSSTTCGRGSLAALGVTWLAFVASATPIGSGAALVSRVAALAAGAGSVYSGGTQNLPCALLVFAAILRQHTGPEAALGMLFIFAALASCRLLPAAGH